MSRKQVLWLITFVLVAPVAVYVVIAGPVGTALTAKQMCSLTFVSNLAPERAFSTYVRPILGPGAWLMHYEIDRVRQRVDADAFGFAKVTAIHHAGYGCVLLRQQSPAAVAALLPNYEAKLPPVWGLNQKHRGAHFDNTALTAAIDGAFNAPGTLAVLVVHAGELVAERYADGIDGDTPLPGWSMSKTVTAVLAGMLAQRKFLTTDEVGLFNDWADDERVHISFDQLLRMTSGIDILENKTGADANSIMLFRNGNTSAYAIGRRLRETPGEVFAYTSGSTMLAARVISDRLGGPRPTFNFIRDELFSPLDMHHTWFEPDERGQFIGSSFIMSSAHDWARFGQLLQNRGRVNGRLYFNASWIDYMTTPTPQATKRPYGAGVWLIDSEHPDQRWMQRLPPGTYYASGLQTNQLWIIPARELVIVRLGATSNFFKSGVIELLQAVLAAQIDPHTQSST